MKRTLLILVAAAILVFAFASVASAKITNGYVAWDSAANEAVGTGLGATPHKGYVEGTDKCAVCHAAHGAPVGGASYETSPGVTPPVWTADPGETEMLLRSTVSNACVYCHISTAIGGKQLYNGNPVLWTNPTSVSLYAENVAHNRNSANCVNCHAVHGANTYLGAATSKILKYSPTTIQSEAIGGSASLYATVADAKVGTVKNAQVTIFCTQCHPNWSNASETTLNAGGLATPYTDSLYKDNNAIANTQYKSHPMKAASTEGALGKDFSAKGGTYTGTVAFAGSEYCRSCHDAGQTDQAAGVTDSNFPHYTAGAYNFMTSASNLGGAQTLHQNGSTDGMCLKCHVNGDSSAGVGITF